MKNVIIAIILLISTRSFSQKYAYQIIDDKEMFVDLSKKAEVAKLANKVSDRNVIYYNKASSYSEVYMINEVVKITKDSTLIDESYDNSWIPLKQAAQSYSEETNDINFTIEVFNNFCDCDSVIFKYIKADLDREIKDIVKLPEIFFIKVDVLKSNKGIIVIIGIIYEDGKDEKYISSTIIKKI